MPRTASSRDRGVESGSTGATGAMRGRCARLDGVGVSVGRTVILRDLDLCLNEGEAVGVLGGNGSGKTTLLHLLATLIVPSAGRGVVLGHELGTRGSMSVRPRIALVGHHPALYPQLSLGENLRFVARLTGRDDRAADRALSRVGLAGAAERRTESCSHGMARRAELARVLLTEPSLLLLDEIHAGLDRDTVALVDEIAAGVCGRGGTCVLVSHEPERLTGLVDRLVRVVDGRADAAALSPTPVGGPR